MAAGDSSVGICNKALLLLGAEPITSFSDGSAAGAACSTIYNEISLTTQGMYHWSFTLKKANLSRGTLTPNSEWTYEYNLPSDMLNGVPRAVRTSSLAGANLYKNWEIGQSQNGSTVLFTEAADIFIDYQKAVAAEVITDQTTKTDYWRAVALGTPGDNQRGGFFRQACSIDSSGQTPTVISDYLLVDVR